MNMQNPFVNEGWVNVYQKYLERYNHSNGEKHSENRIQQENHVTRKFIEESHNLFFYNAFNTIEAKRPVHSIYKRPI
jgi:hypothetical protein